MEKYYDKLYDLYNSQVLFPPEILLHMRPECGQHVVGVHEDVNEGVDDAKESRMTASNELHTDPTADRHHRMMVEMQERDLSIFLAQNEEHRIQ